MKKLFYYVLLLTLLSSYPLASNAQVSLTPPSTYLDGDVNDQLIIGNTRYLTGSFKKVYYRPDNTSKIVSVSNASISTTDAGAQLTSTSSLSLPGMATAVCSDTINGVTYYAYQSGSGGGIAAYRANVGVTYLSVYTNTPITKMIYANAKLIFIGSFTNINGQTAKYIGLFNTTTNALQTGLTYNGSSNTSSLDVISIQDLTYCSYLNSVLLAGKASSGNRILNLNLSSGNVVHYIANITQLTTVNSIVCSNIAGQSSSIVFIGGKGTSTQLVAYNIPLGTPVTGLPSFNAAVNSLAYASGYLYIGGCFTSPQMGFVVYRVNNSTLLKASYAPAISMNVTNGVKKIVAVGSYIHVFGDFGLTTGSSTYSKYFRVIYGANSWLTDSYFINPDISFSAGTTLDANFTKQNNVSGLTFISNSINGVNTLMRDRLVAYSTADDKPLVSFNENNRTMSVTGNGIALAAIPGSTTSFLWMTPSTIIAVATNGVYNTFNRTKWLANSGVFSAMSVNGNDLYVAGNFMSIQFTETATQSATNSSQNYKVIKFGYTRTSGLFNTQYGFYNALFSSKINRVKTLVNNQYLGVCGSFTRIISGTTTSEVPGIAMLDLSPGNYPSSSGFTPALNLSSGMQNSTTATNIMDMYFLNTSTPVVVAMGKRANNINGAFSPMQVYYSNGQLMQTVYSFQNNANYYLDNAVAVGNDLAYTFTGYNTGSTGSVHMAATYSSIQYSFLVTNVQTGVSSLPADSSYCPGAMYTSNSTNHVLLTGKYTDGYTSVYSYHQFAVTAPTIAPSNLTFSNITPTSLTVNYTRGNGANALLMIKAGSNTTAAPVDGATYFYSSVFGNGGNYINGWYVFYIGAGTTANISGLSPSTSYVVRAYELNGSGSNTRYSTTFGLGSVTTPTYKPTLPATNAYCTNIGSSSITINWSNGNGNRRIVAMRPTNPVNFFPADNTIYGTNTNYSLAPVYGTDVRFVYSGTGNTVTVSGLASGTNYQISVFEYNLVTNSVTGTTQPYYLTTNPATTSTTTVAIAPEPTISASNLIASNIQSNSATLNWTNGNGANRILIGIAGTNLSISSISIPQGSIYLANSDASIAALNTTITTNLGQAMVLYNGNGTSVNVSGLAASTNMSLALVEYNGVSAGTTSYRVSTFPVCLFKTAANVFTPNANSSSITAISDRTSILLNWSKGSGANRIVVARQGSPVNWNPLNNTSYSASSVFGSSPAQNGSNYVVYNGNGNSCLITNLTPNTPYFFTIYEYNSSMSVYKYLTPGAGKFQTTMPNWPQVAGGSDKDAGGGVIIGTNGNIYVAGTFNGTAYFGTRQVVSNGDNDIFLACYSGIGELLWVKGMGSSSQDAASAIAQDASGKIYITGSYRNTASFGNSISLTSQGIDDIFIAKFDANGNCIWATSAGGTDQDVAYSVAVDNNSNPVITGYFNQLAQFGATSLISAGGTEVFVAKYNGNTGSLLWANKGGSPSRDLANSVSIGPNNAVYICGEFKGNSTFQSQNGQNISIQSNGSETDIFVARYTSSGNLDYAKSYGSTGTDAAYAIVADTNTAEAYVAGLFSGVASFGSITKTSFGNSDAFLMKLDASGIAQWVDQLGGVSQDAAHGITMYNGTLYIAGSFSDMANFGSFSLNAINKNLDVFLISANSSGTILSANQYGGSTDDDVRGVSSNGSNVFVTGYYSSTATFGGTDVSSRGSWDMFVYNTAFVNAVNSPSTGLVAWYPMNNSFTDMGPNGFNGSVVRGSPVSMNDRNGTANDAFQFNQSRMQFNLAAASTSTNYSDEEEEATFCAWLKPGILVGNMGQIIGVSQASTPRSMNVYYTPDFRIRADILDASNNYQTTLISAGTVLLNEWVHIAVTIKSGAYMKIFMNGSETDNIPLTSNLKAYFGNMTGSVGELNSVYNSVVTYALNAGVDDVRIYKRALTAAELANIMNLPSSQSFGGDHTEKTMSVQATWNVFPNPGKDWIQLYTSQKQNSDIHIRVIDMQGRCVHEQNQLANEWDGQLSMNLSSLKAGFYSVQIEQNATKQLIKLIISE